MNGVGLTSRWTALRALCAAAAVSAITMTIGTVAAAASGYMRPDAGRLRTLAQQLAGLPRRRDYKTLPMIPTRPNQWDSEALDVLLAYDGPRHIFDTTQLAGSWVNQIRNTMNAQVFSLQRPNFLCVAAPHGGAALALFTQAAWDKYKLADQTDGAFENNSSLTDRDFPASQVSDPANAEGLYSDAGNFMPTLQKRGVVFIGCHNAIWELAGTLLKGATNPDGLSHGALAADLTNRLIPGAISTRGNEAMLGKFQESGFVYGYA